MAAVLMFAAMVLLTPTVAEIYKTQDSDKCSGMDLTACSKHYLRCPDEGPPSVIALSQAKNGFRRSSGFSRCSYQVSCDVQSTCCVRHYFRFCYQDFANDHLMDLAHACLMGRSCEFRSPVARANSSICRIPVYDSDESLMSTIQYFCVPQSTILDARMGFQSISETQGASIIVTRSQDSEQASTLSRTVTCVIWSSAGRNNRVSLFQYAFINGAKSRNWYVRVEDSINSLAEFSPFHEQTDVVAKKSLGGLLTPITVHVRVEYTGAPSLLWLGFEAEDYTRNFNMTCSSSNDTSKEISTIGTMTKTWQTAATVDSNITSHEPTFADDGANSSFPTAAASDAQSSKDSSSTIALVIGTVVGAILVVVLAAVLLFIVRRRHQNKNESRARHHLTLPSSTTLDDYGYCIPVISGCKLTTATDNSTVDVLMEANNKALSRQQQLMKWRHSPMEDGSATSSAASPKTTTEDDDVEVHANVFHNYGFEDDMESGIDDDSFTSEFDEVCPHDPNVYANDIVEGNSVEDCSDHMKDVVSHDDEPIYQELDLEEFDNKLCDQNGGTLRHQESICREAQDSRLLHPIREENFEGASHSAASTQWGEETPACLDDFVDTQLDDLPRAPKWPSRESSLYALGRAPSPPWTPPSESQTLLTKARQGVREVKKRVRELFAKKERFTPGEHVSKEMTSIVACGEGLDGALYGAQFPVTVSAIDDRVTATGDASSAGLPEYSTVMKCNGFRRKQEPKNTDIYDVPCLADDVDSVSDDTTREDAVVYRLGDPMKENGQMDEQSSAPGQDVQRQCGEPSCQHYDEANPEVATKISRDVIEELKKLDWFQSTSGKPGRRQKNGDSTELAGSAPEVISKKKRSVGIKGPNTAGQRLASPIREKRVKKAVSRPSKKSAPHESGLAAKECHDARMPASTKEVHYSNCADLELSVDDARQIHETHNSLPGSYCLTDNSNPVETRRMALHGKHHPSIDC